MSDRDHVDAACHAYRLTLRRLARRQRITRPSPWEQPMARLTAHERDGDTSAKATRPVVVKRHEAITGEHYV